MTARSWSRWARKPYIAPFGGDHVRLTQENNAAVVDAILTAPYDVVERIAEDKREPSLVYIYAQAIVGAAERQEFTTVDRMLNRVIGRPATQAALLPLPGMEGHHPVVPPFDEFCVKAGYPEPFQLQDDMRRFGIDERGARLLLGARGYGKTDYVVVCGVAYDLIQNPMEATYLLVTKSDERNAAILAEVARILELFNVPLERKGGKVVRVAGLVGKDHSLAAVTIGSASLRGRHPKYVIMDDPVTPEDVSQATRKRAQRVYEELTKLTPNVLVVGQPVHKFDLYETLRPLAAVKKMEIKHGAIPELDHDLEAQRLAGVSIESIKASYHLEVVAENGNPLEKVQRLPSWPPGGSAVAFIDPSFEGGDYTALTIVKQHFAGIAVWGEVWKRAWYDCIDEMAQRMEARGVQRVAFETNSLGEQPVVLLRDLELMDGIGVVGRRSEGNKHARIMAAGPFASSIFMCEDSEQIYKDQVRKYEYGAKNDDAPDSLASCMAWIGLIRPAVSRKAR